MIKILIFLLDIFGINSIVFFIFLFGKNKNTNPIIIKIHIFVIPASIKKTTPHNQKGIRYNALCINFLNLSGFIIPINPKAVII